MEPVPSSTAHISDIKRPVFVTSSLSIYSEEKSMSDESLVWIWILTTRFVMAQQSM